MYKASPSFGARNGEAIDKRTHIRNLLDTLGIRL
jgi:hypothetical protein